MSTTSKCIYPAGRFFEKTIVLPDGVSCDPLVQTAQMIRKIMQMDNTKALELLNSVREIDTAVYNGEVRIFRESAAAYYDVSPERIKNSLHYRGFLVSDYPSDAVAAPPAFRNKRRASVEMFSPRLVLAIGYALSASTEKVIKAKALPVVQKVEQWALASADDELAAAETQQEIISPEETPSEIEGIPVTESGSLVLAPELLANIVKTAVKEAMADLRDTQSSEPEPTSENDIDQSLEAVCTLYRNGELNIAQASELSGLSRADFRSRFSSLRRTV